MSDIGQFIADSRGFLSGSALLGRFAANKQKAQEEYSQPVRLGDYAAKQLDPLGRLAAIHSGLPGGTFYGGAQGALPTLDWLNAHGNPFRDPYAHPSSEFAQSSQTGKGTGTTGTTGRTGDGANWAGPTTAADNQGLTGQQVDQYIKDTRPASPLVGMGQYILDEANRQNISVPQLLGIMNLESGLGTTGGLNGVYNYGGLTGTGWSGQTGNTTGMARPFATFGSARDGINALIANLASDLYRGKNLQQQTATWYLGRPDAGLDETDEAGNATLRDYLNVINQAYQGLGRTSNPQAAPARTNTGGSALDTIWGGIDAKVSQDFGATDFSEANRGIYAYETDFGMAPGQHTGIDVGVKRGTQLYMPASFSGTVVERAPGYYKDEDYGDDGSSYGRGELRIQLDNGWQLILGHNSQINVRPGDRVNPGQLVALSGSANGDHVHIELRIPDRSTPSGWRIVNPADYFNVGQR